MNLQFEYRNLISQTTHEESEGCEMPDFLLQRVPIPEPLKFVYEIAGKAKINQFHNRLYEPADLSVADDGFVTFAEENQSVVLWGYKASERDDTMVYQRIFDGESYGEWIEEGQPMDHFLISLGFWNAANGAADAVAVGEIGPETRSKVDSLPIAWKTQGFTIRSAGPCYLLLTEGEDFYAFGKDADHVIELVDAMDVSWYDME